MRKTVATHYEVDRDKNHTLFKAILQKGLLLLDIGQKNDHSAAFFRSDVVQLHAMLTQILADWPTTKGTD